PAASVPSSVSMSSSAMFCEPRKHGFASVNLFADRCVQPGIERQVDIHARAEADEAEPVALAQDRAGLDVAQDAPGDKAGDLHASHILAVAGPQPQRGALVVERGLVER